MRWTKAMAAAVILVLLLCMGLVQAGPFAYSIPIQSDELTIQPDGSVDLVRYFEFAVASTSSDNGTEIWAGLPTSATSVSSVVDEKGNKVSFSTRSSGGQYVVVLKGFSPIKPGQKLGFTVTARIPGFLYPDQRNTGYATMQYVPAWWDQADVVEQRVFAILPAGVTQEEVKTGERQWDGVDKTQDGRMRVYWQQKTIKAGQRLTVAVGFPDKYLNAGALTSKSAPNSGGTNYNAPTRYSYSTGPSPLVFLAPFLIFFGVFAILAMSMAGRRQGYTRPSMAMEGVGVNRDLDPVEAAVLLRKEPQQVLNMLMFKMLMENRIKLVGRDPLQLEPIYTDGLKAHEKLFVEAIDLETKTLDEAKLATSFRTLVRNVVEKVRPYCRRDTERYYQGKVEEAWLKVRQAEAPDVKFKEYDANLLWLIMNDEMQEKYGHEIEETMARQPEPALQGWWFWPIYHNFFWGYGPFTPFGAFNHLYLGSTFIHHPQVFNEIQQSQFTPPAPRGGGPGPGPMAPPPSCACACACVSCACACACAGGGGCT